MKPLSIDDFKDFTSTIRLAADDFPRKRINYVLKASKGPNNSLELINEIHVTDKFDNIVYTGNHLSLAIKAYNSLL